ncbi:TIGR03086 family metal-binding protein [Actinomadura opuntiae]|uniref:TIGR03086 family metal-binding protein n=1 Tax=Actinomadura sp. OS1-43 TaxID=604315 RepID=UPI00255ADD19|nr:TIGR03086 family metal-binding protein [Actinomadura sp. OS1-43]MDL4813879.1 TIGR03086 family metal-binding protein [Actinomadura sp. OS1-43]
MEVRSQLRPAADVAARIVLEIPKDRLDDPTPCPGWDVRALVNHLILWNGRGETAARKEPTTGPGEDHDFTAEPGWAERFQEQARRTADAWNDPAAWEGNTSLTGNKEGMPAAFIAGIVLGECVVHGWDLAVATGRDPGFPPEVVQAAWEQLVPTAEVSRKYGAFGPEVPVPGDAPLLDRVLGLAGRDPYWKP